MSKSGKPLEHAWWHHLVTALVGVVMYGLLSILAVEIGIVGYLAYKQLPYPLSMILGITLIGVGSTMFLVVLYELLVRVLSTRYTQTHCLICRDKSA